MSYIMWGFPGGASGKKKNLSASAGDRRDTGLIPSLGRSPGGGHGNPLQYSCLENPMDRGAWQALVRGRQRVRHDWSNLAYMHVHIMYINKYINPCIPSSAIRRACDHLNRHEPILESSSQFQNSIFHYKEIRLLEGIQLISVLLLRKVQDEPRNPHCTRKWDTAQIMTEA